MKRFLACLLTLVLMLSCVTLGLAEAAEEKTAISIFISDVGVTYPDGWDPADNFMINQLAEWANVTFDEVHWPMSDTNTQFNLLVAGGEMPDLVEVGWIRPDLRKYASQGAFADITDLPLIAKNYNEAQIEFMKQPEDGRIYVLDSLPIDRDYDAIFLRVDLLEKAGYDHIPQTLDEYVEAMRAVKAWDPNAVVYTCRGINYQHWFLTDPFNTAVSGFKWNYDYEAGAYTGFANQWEGDNIIKAVEFAKMLYDEGLLDREFITNDRNAANEKRLNQNCLIFAQNRGGISASMQSFATTPGLDDARLIPVPTPVDPSCGRDAYYTAPGLAGGYNFAINALCDEAEYAAAARVLDVLYSDDMKDLYVYGREGIEYEVADNGSKIPLFPAANDSAWRENFGLAWTCNSTESMNYYVNSAIHMSNAFTAEQKEQYYDEFLSAITDIDENYLCKMAYGPSISTAAPDEITNASNECIEKQRALYADAIIGNITLDEFKAEKEALVEKYQFVTDWWNAEFAALEG